MLDFVINILRIDSRTCWKSPLLTEGKVKLLETASKKNCFGEYDAVKSTLPYLRVHLTASFRKICELVFHKHPSYRKKYALSIEEN